VETHDPIGRGPTRRRTVDRLTHALLRRAGIAATCPVEQLHVTWAEDASRGFVVSWFTPGAVDEPFVAVDGRRIAAVTVPAGSGWYHHARVGPTDPGTVVTYTVGHDDEVRSRPGRIRMGPAGPAPFTFTAFGDHGTATPAPDVPPTVDAARTTALVEALDPAFHLVAGDLSYANGDTAVWDRWFRMIEPSARRRPWIACLGNHEMERPASDGGFSRDEQDRGPLGYAAFRSRIPVPGARAASTLGTYGSFRYAGVRFVLLDNNDVSAEFPANRGYTDGRQREWLATLLAATRRDPSVECVVVVMHQPAFSSAVGHGSDLGVRAAWHDLFVTHDVALVLQGHDHLYERTRPLAGTAARPVVREDGVTYVTCGNGGHAVAGAAGGRRPSWSAVRDDRGAGVVRVAVEPARDGRAAELRVTHHPVDRPEVPSDAFVVRSGATPARSATAAHAGRRTVG
jgi:hypothetical protein